MTAIYSVLRVSPMIPSYDIPKTSAFFIDLFDFKPYMGDDKYAILYKDDLTVHLLNAGTDIGEMEFYLEVDDVDAVWAGISDKIADIKVRPPFDRDYGMRELHIIIPHTKALMFVGQVIKP